MFILVPNRPLFHSTVCHQVKIFVEKLRLDLWHKGSLSSIAQTKQKLYFFGLCGKKKG